MTVSPFDLDTPSPDPALPPRDVVTVMGVPLDAVEPGRAGQRAASLIERKPQGFVVTPNLDIVRQSTKSPELMDLIVDADLSLADGEPLVWASRIIGTPLTGRAPGASVMWQVLEEAERRQWSVAIVGGPEGAATKAAERISERLPHLTCDGLELGFDLNDVEVARLAHRLRTGAYTIVMLGLGFPRQEQLAQRLVQHNHVTSWFFSIGAGVEFAAGTKRRAPELFQRLGVEWLHRLVTEPRRLWRRYLLHGLPFALRLLVWSLRHRSPKSPSRRPVM